MNASTSEFPTVSLPIATEDDTAPLKAVTDDTMTITAILEAVQPTRPHFMMRAWRYFVDVGIERWGIVRVGIVPLCAVVGLYIGAILAPDAVPNVVKNHLPGIEAQAPATTAPLLEKKSDQELPSVRRNVPAQVSKTQKPATTKSPEASPSASASASVSASASASSSASSSPSANPMIPAETESSAPAPSSIPSVSASASPTPEDATPAAPTVAPTSETPVSSPATEASVVSVDDTSTPIPTS